MSQQKFEAIYNTYFNKVYNFIYSRTYLQDDTEDIVQETFVGIWKSIDKLDESKNIQAWVFQIARNKLNDYLKQKYQITEKFSLLSLDNTGDDDLEDYNDHEDKSFLDKAHNEAVKMIGKLEDNYRKVLELRFLKGYKLTEIAKELNLSENNVKVIQNRAIRKLKELIINV